MSNPVIDTMMNRKSIRKYKKDPVPDEVIAAVVRAGQQAPFAYQMCSLLLSRNQKRNPFKAPLLFTLCVDSHRHELVMAQRKWTMVQNDLSLLLFGIQDAAYVAENMVIAAESVGLGSCFLGGAPYQAAKIVKEYQLPPRVFPLVQLTMGYPAENPATRPRYPLEFTLFEDTYRELSDEQVQHAMQVMDEGYLAQDYYRKGKYLIPLEREREETYTFENYSWTEHISRKTGQWYPSVRDVLEPLAKCGFHIVPEQ
ncbi:MAG: nitroreductase family protein [Spirochaetia bacterium]